MTFSTEALEKIVPFSGVGAISVLKKKIKLANYGLLKD
jgi:hypothetical protein